MAISDTTRGTILRMIDTQIEGGVLSKIEWLEDLPKNDAFALGYMLGLMMEKAQRIADASQYNFTPEQKKEHLEAIRKMLNDSVHKIMSRIGTERNR